VLSPLEQQLNPVRLVEALARGAVALGAELRGGQVVRGLLRHGDRVRGVRLADGSTTLAGHVVLAAGAWAARCGDWLGYPVPVAPVKGQMLAVQPEGGTFRYTLYGRKGYLVPKADGSLFVGATVEQAGFDRRVTVAGMHQLMQMLVTIAPDLAEARFLRAWAGLRPATPDHRPILGTVPGLQGVSLAAGHYRNGILLAAITGEVIAQVALGDAPSLSLEPFSVARFAARPSMAPSA
jgi:glycine oxidase